MIQGSTKMMNGLVLMVVADGAGNDGSMAWEWAAFLMEALSDMRMVFRS